MIFEEGDKLDTKLLTAERFIDMRCGCSYRYVVSTTEYFRPHYHDYYELFVMLNGNAYHKVNDEQFKLKKGDIVFIRPSDIHDYTCEKGKSFSMMNITFNMETAKELFSFLGQGFPTDNILSLRFPPQASMTSAEFEWFNSRMDSICAIPETDYEKIKTSLRILLFRLLTHHFSDFSQRNTEMPLWLDNLLEEMKLDGNYVFGLSRMCELSGKSREHIARCVKKYTGTTCTEYINGLRLNYIASMLKNSNHKITDIIFESGFNNISWASELFKKKFGVTMLDYRNKIN